MKELSTDSVDSIVTDPPYGYFFLKNKWDYDIPSIGVWREALRVLKPGGYLISFSAARNYHRMVINIEDAGFEIKDQLGWLYTSGFPKRMNVGKMIDKAVRGVPQGGKDPTSNNHGKFKGGQHMGAGPGQFMREAGIIEKPRAEQVVAEAAPWLGWGTALKPSFEPMVLARKPSDLTIAQNILQYGMGALNIDATRIEHEGEHLFPTNIITDGSADVVDLFPTERHSQRFFYCAKPNDAEKAGSSHSTIKPAALVRYLCRLITPVGGTVLDMYAGRGSTAKAALDEGMHAILIENDQEFCAEMRIRFNQVANLV